MGKHNPIPPSLRNILPLGLLFLIHLSAGSGLFVLASTEAGDVIIDVSDVLQIEIQSESMLSVTRKVNDSGSFPYPLLREVEALGKTPNGLAKHIEKRLYDEEFLWEPHVTVTVIDRPGYVVRVGGEVKEPGQTAFAAGMRLRDVLMEHGGVLDDQAGPDLLLWGRRRSVPLRIDRHLLSPSSGPGSELLNLCLRPGDEIVVPVAEEYFVAGAVRRPAPRLLTRRIVLSQALSDAGGPVNDSDGWVIVRRKESRGLSETLVKLSDVQGGLKAADRSVQARQTVTVVVQGFVYVGGRVEHFGAYEWSKDLTIRKALTKAGAPADLPDAGLRIIRWGVSEEIRVRDYDDLVIDRDVILVRQD